MSLTQKDKEWLFSLAKQVVSTIEGSYGAACFSTHESEFLASDESDKNYCPDCLAFLPSDPHKPMCLRRLTRPPVMLWGEGDMSTEDIQNSMKRGYPTCGRTMNEKHRPLVCFVCAKQVPVSFNFCLEHKDEYERLRGIEEAWKLDLEQWEEVERLRGQTPSKEKSMKVTIVESSSGDWQGMYIDGVLKSEDHRLSLENVLSALGLAFDIRVTKKDWLEDAGHLPEHIQEVKFAKR